MMTTSFLSYFRLPGRLDKVHPRTTPKAVNDARVASYAVALSSSALIGVRELASVHQMLPPSFWLMLTPAVTIMISGQWWSGLASGPTHTRSDAIGLARACRLCVSRKKVHVGSQRLGVRLPSEKTGLHISIKVQRENS